MHIMADPPIWKEKLVAIELEVLSDWTHHYTMD